MKGMKAMKAAKGRYRCWRKLTPVPQDPHSLLQLFTESWVQAKSNLPARPSPMFVHPTSSARSLARPLARFPARFREHINSTCPRARLPALFLFARLSEGLLPGTMENYFQAISQGKRGNQRSRDPREADEGHESHESNESQEVRPHSTVAATLGKNTNAT